jgi:glycerate kinase
MLDETAYTLNDAGFAAVFSLCPGPVPLADAVEHAARYLALTTEQVVRCMQPASHGNASDSDDC